MRRYGIDSTLLVANQIEALVAIGEWDEADRAQRRRAPRASPRASRTCSSCIRADVEIGRGDFDAARAHLDAARATLREDRGLGVYDVYLAELALWERRWTDAEAAVATAWRGRTPARGGPDPRLALRQGAARTGGAGGARARPPGRRRRPRLARPRAESCSATARRAAAEASAITPNAAGWLALAEAEYERARGVGAPESWSEAAATWERLERPPLAAYCRWREAEALVAAGVPHRGERAAPRGARRRGSDRSQDRCCASSSCSPNGRGSISRRRSPRRREQPAWRRPSG